MSSVKLNASLINGLEVKEKDYAVYDALVPGFFVKVTPKGKKVYYLWYRTRDGRPGKKKLGDHGIKTPHQAREEARQLLNAIASGADPARELADAKAAPTVAESAARFKEYVAAHNKPSTAKEYGRVIDRWIVPRWGSTKLGNLRLADIEGLHQQLKATPYEANRLLAVVSSMLSRAIKVGDLPKGSNFCPDIKRYPEHRRGTILTTDQMKKLGEALRTLAVDERHRTVAYVLLLLLFTGCRKGEHDQRTFRQLVEDRGQQHLDDEGRCSGPLGKPLLSLSDALGIVGAISWYGMLSHLDREVLGDDDLPRHLLRQGEQVHDRARVKTGVAVLDVSFDGVAVSGLKGFRHHLDCGIAAALDGELVGMDVRLSLEGSPNHFLQRPVFDPKIENDTVARIGGLGLDVGRHLFRGAVERIEVLGDLYQQPFRRPLVPLHLPEGMLDRHIAGVERSEVGPRRTMCLRRLAKNVSTPDVVEQVAFVACDMPMANRLTIHVLAAVAEHEREMISARTKAALAAAKARGVKLGNPANLGNRLTGSITANKVKAEKAHRRARDLIPVIDAIQAGGHISLRSIAAALDERGISAPRGGRWSACQVMRLLDYQGLGV